KDDDYLLLLRQFVTNARERFEFLQVKTSLAETIELIISAKVCEGNDTDIALIAEALGIPSIVLFGPTHPDFGFGTHGDHSKNIWIGEPCSPCSTLGDKPCKFATQNCMEKIQVNTVLQEITKVCAL